MPPTPAQRGNGRGDASNRTRRPQGRRPNEARDRDQNRRPRSIAVVEVEVTLQSQQAQYVQERALFRVMRSLYAISVILRHIAAPKEVDDVLKVVYSRIDEVRKGIEQEHARLAKILKDSGAEPKLTFTQPAPVKVQISSPHAKRYLDLITFLDIYMALVETLWLSDLLDDAQRHEAQEAATGHVLSLAGQINDIETRAREAARRQGKDEVVAEELAETGDARAPDETARDTDVEKAEDGTGASRTDLTDTETSDTSRDASPTGQADEANDAEAGRAATSARSAA